MTPEWEQDAREAERAAAPYGRCILTICAECAAEDATYEGAGPTGPAKE